MNRPYSPVENPRALRCSGAISEVQELMFDVAGSEEALLNDAVRDVARRVHAPVAVLCRPSAEAFGLIGSYVVDGEPRERLPEIGGAKVPNQWQVANRRQFTRVFPIRANWLSRHFLEKHAYPSPAAVSYYANYDYAGWAEYPLVVGGRTEAKLTFMQKRTLSTPCVREMQTALTPVLLAWHFTRQRRRLEALLGPGETDAESFLSALDALLQHAGRAPAHSARAIAATAHLRRVRDAARRALDSTSSGPMPRPRRMAWLALATPMLARGVHAALQPVFPTWEWRMGPPAMIDTKVALLLVEVKDPEAAKQLALLKKRHPRSRVLAIIPESATGLAASCLRAGADGVTLDSSSADQFIEAVRSVTTGRKWVARLAQRQLDVGAPSPLSPRERAVLGCAADGCSDKEIAGKIGCAISSVRTHLKRVFRKLGVHSRGAAVRVAREQGEV